MRLDVRVGAGLAGKFFEEGDEWIAWLVGI